MNKKLIAAAIAAVMAAPVVSAADTTLYGKVHVDVRNADNGVSGVDNYTVNSNASRLGVKGSEDLGDGLKAIFGLEWTYDVTDGGANGGARNSFGGLSGGFGTFVVGRHDTPAKIALNSVGLSAVSDSIVDFEGVGGRTFTEVRASNAIAYISPSFSGFTVAGAIVPGEQTGNPGSAAVGAVVLENLTFTSAITPQNGNDGIADSYSLGLMYSGYGLKAGLGYEVLGDGGNLPAGVSDDHKMMQVAASYTFGDFMVGGAYEDTEDFGNAAGLDKTAWGLTAKANFGNNFVAANFANVEYDASGIGSDDYDVFGLVVGHKFSKRTQVYAAYVNRDGGGASSALVDNTGATPFQVDESDFALGMIHNF